MDRAKIGWSSRQSMSMCRRILVLVICFCECFLFGGTFFGWASMSFILLQDGVYNQLCSNTTGADNMELHSVLNTTGYTGTQTNSSYYAAHECAEQQAQLSLAFMIGFIMFGVSALPLGWLFDRFGLWFSRILAWVLAGMGYCCLAFASQGMSWIIFPGSICIAASCNILILTNMHICKLAGKRTALCVTVYNGALSASTLIYLLLKIGFQHGIGRKYVILIYIGTLFIVPLTTLSLLPHYKIESQNPENESEVEPTQKKPQMDAQIDAMGVKNLIKTALYCSIVVWFASTHMRVVAFIGFFNGWLNQVVEGDENLVNYFVNVFAIVQISGSVAAPISGVIFDVVRKNTKHLELKGLHLAVLGLPSAIITATSAIVLSILVLIPIKQIIYVAIITSEILRSFTYATGLAFLSICFPAAHYGVLFGSAYFVLGLTTILQVPYTIIAEQFGYTWINICLLVTSMLSMVLPITIAVKHSQRKA